MDPLAALTVLDLLPAERFERYVRIARRMFGTPIVQVVPVDANLRWRADAPSRLIIPDTRADARFASNPLATREPGVRFYAGRALRMGSTVMGTLCLIDYQPRRFSEADTAMLEDLACMLEEEIILFRESSTDRLTGLANRSGFLRTAEHLLHVCCRMEQSVVMVFLDIDHFQRIQKTFGHAAGDQALRDTAGLLSGVFRRSDVVGRIGDDEFCILCTATSDQATLRARLSAALAEYNRSSMRPWHLSFSIGMEGYDPAFHQTAEDLLRDADAVAYATRALLRGERNVG